jgi:acyl carrier protein
MPNINEIKASVFNIIASMLEDQTITVSENTPLSGNDSPLDSVKLVALCLTLEETAADLGFNFDWTSSSAMSKSRSMFQTAGTLANVFITQFETKA